jgi:hypothetical protein
MEQAKILDSEAKIQDWLQEYKITGDIYRRLNAYQILQLRHDKLFHQEIFVLDISRRMNHIALHLTKYLGSLYYSPMLASGYRKAFIDAFIMVVSASNLLGISLAHYLSSAASQEEIEGDFICNYIQSLSSLAKACEASDHQEDYPIREVWNKNIKTLFLLLLRESALLNVDVLREARERLVAVEKEHPLREIMMEG